MIFEQIFTRIANIVQRTILLYKSLIILYNTLFQTNNHIEIRLGSSHLVINKPL